MSSTQAYVNSKDVLFSSRSSKKSNPLDHLFNTEHENHASLNEYHMEEIQAISWLNQQEELHSVVLYQCDWHASEWTRLCIRQADVICLLGNAADANSNIQPSALEREIEDEETTNAKRELVLLHINPGVEYQPQGTLAWITARKGI